MQAGDLGCTLRVATPARPRNEDVDTTAVVRSEHGGAVLLVQKQFSVSDASLRRRRKGKTRMERAAHVSVHIPARSG
eukprot:5870642-Pleurochrysis_carterae.AAC.2